MTSGGKRETWLTAPSEEWAKRFGAGTFPFGIAGRAFKPLAAAGHSSETIARHLARYLDATNPQYLSLPKFAQTFASWGPNVLAGDFTVDDTGVLCDG